MNKILLTITAVLINAVCVLNAQTVTQSWATLAFGAEPNCIAIDASGNVYTANNNNTISKMTPDGVVADPWATLASNAYPVGIVVDASGNLYTANGANNTVSKITSTGMITQSWVTLTRYAYPVDIAIDASGNLYTANSGNNTVSKIMSTGEVTQSWATLAKSNPNAIAIDASGNVYTANNNSTVSKITSNGVVTQPWATLASDAHASAIATDASGNVYTANFYNNTVSKITPGGVATQYWATLASNAEPFGISIDASGNVYTANSGNNTVSKITPGGIETQSWAALGSSASPRAIALDASGNLYTANVNNNTVSKISQVPKIVYVNASASGANDGTSWTNAFIYFQTGVNSAAFGDSVFVAGGNYPLAAGYSYNMKEGVKIYGSFAGTESSLSQRNLAASNSSVLKGSDQRVVDNNSNNLTSAAVLDGFTITGGHADYGAGMYNYGSSPTISNCSFWGNTANGYGGGMENSSASPVLINCVFSGNSVTGGAGGGIYNYASTAIMTNCTFFGNTASSGGGGIYNSSSSPILTNTIFWGNTAPSGADILQNGGSFSINHSYTQTDFTASSATNITGSIDPFVNSGMPAGADGIYGTADDGLHLANGSAAINTGITDISGLNLPVTDITGLPRTARSRIDMGAYEFNTAATWYVIENATGNGGSWLNASGDFQGTINGAYSGDSVFVAGGTYQPVTSGASFSMKAGVKIYGGFEGTESALNQRNLAAGDSSILKGNGASVIRNANDGLDASAILDGFAITEGHANGSFQGGMGGGIFNDNGTPLFSNLIIENNSATLFGGGMYVENSSPTLFNVVFSNNSASRGGGIYNGMGACVSVTNSTFCKNGGVAFINYSSLIPVLNSVIMWGNEISPGADFSIYLENGSGSPLVSNSLIAGCRGSSNWYYAKGTDGGGNLDIDPKFVDAAGGDFRLKITSQAINGGSNNIPIWDTIALGGNPRIFDKVDGGIVDMGAYEYEGNPIRPDLNGILYVNSAAAPGGDGSSWGTAIQSLGTAINGGVIINETASLSADSLRQIWVAKGTYQPDTVGHSFFMLPKVKIYGSFEGTEDHLADRILTAEPTSVLKGRGNTVIRNYMNGLDTTAVLDGFSITGGYSTSSDITQSGGGILNYSVSPAMSHLLIVANEAYYGGAILNNGGAAVFTNVVVIGNTSTAGTIYNSNSGSLSPTFMNVVIAKNIAGFAGGMFNGLSSPRLTNVVISGNSAIQLQGGGLMNLLAHPVLTNVTITGNSAANSGGGIYNFTGSTTELINSIVWGNTAPIGNEIANEGATIIFNHSLYGNGTNDVVESNGGTSTIDAYCLSTDPKFVDAANGIYQLQESSPAINAGDNNSIPVWDTTDVAGNVRIYGRATGGMVDMGAYEYQNFALPVKMGKLTGSVGKERHAILSWTTFSEIQNKGFQMEYSLDGIHFKDGSFVPSKAQGGNSVSTLHYTVDGGALFSATYFRVKQVSLDGTTLISNVVYLPVVNNVFGLTAFPNPVHNLVNVRIEGEISPRGQLMILDMAGRILKRVSITDVNAKVDVSGLAAGIYMLQYTDEKHNATIKLIKK